MGRFGYRNIKDAIFKEVPKILYLEEIKEYFNISYNIKALWDDKPQLYILISGEKQ